MDDKRQGARRRFDRALAAHGEAALTDQLVAWVEKTFGQPLEELGDEEFDEAVETVAERRAEAPIFGGAKKRRAAPSGPRAEQPPAESALAGSEWHAYLEGHVERVLASFAWLRDDARLRLGLRPLTPGAPSTYRVAMAWLTGDERFLDVDDDDGELAQLGDREAAQYGLSATFGQAAPAARGVALRGPWARTGHAVPGKLPSPDQPPGPCAPGCRSYRLS